MEEAPERTTVVVIGGGLFGSMTALMLARRNIDVVVLEAREDGAPLKHAVGEAITEGSSIFLRHEMGLDDWLAANTFRKFGFDFLLLPESGETPRRMEDCHELLLSLTPLEKTPALQRLIPTYHVDRTNMDAEVRSRAIAEGVDYRNGASVTSVDIGDGEHHVHYRRGDEDRVLTCNWVMDCSGRRCVLGRQLEIHEKVEALPTAAIWNRFKNVDASMETWSTFGNVDRRRHTVHFAGHGFWFWWIHQNDGMTSVGVSFDKRLHQPDIKAADRGFSEMLDKFPVVRDLLRDAEPLEDYHYLAHLPFRSEHWLSTQGYALIGDAGWFVDALYSTAIETAARQLMIVVPMIVDQLAGKAPCPDETARVNEEFSYLQKAALAHNRFKYEYAWGNPRAFFQIALYELAEIAELYHLQRKSDWQPGTLAKHYRLQWGSKRRLESLESFLENSRGDPMPAGALLKKSLSPGPVIYHATWPLWRIPGMSPYFFIITRVWGFVERYAQRFSLFPDFLSLMANRRPPQLPAPKAENVRG